MYLRVYFEGIEMFHQFMDKAEAGDQVGALVRGVKREDVRRGCVIVKPDTLEMANRFETQVSACDCTYNDHAVSLKRAGFDPLYS